MTVPIAQTLIPEGGYISVFKIVVALVLDNICG